MLRYTRTCDTSSMPMQGDRMSLVCFVWPNDSEVMQVHPSFTVKSALLQMPLRPV